MDGPKNCHSLNLHTIITIKLLLWIIIFYNFSNIKSKRESLVILRNFLTLEVASNRNNEDKWSRGNMIKSDFVYHAGVEKWHTSYVACRIIELILTQFVMIYLKFGKT